MKRRRDGFTIIELMLSLGLIVIFSMFMFAALLGRKGKTELDSDAQKIAALLREAQSRSVAQASSTGWGVYFQNATTSFYALYGGTSYSTSSRINYIRLSTNVQFITSTLAVNATKTISFAQITGIVNASTSIGVSLRNDTRFSSTISVASSGAVRF
jgi:prepilin-type N-terminal cleavage/methylation domain-containing protein